MKLTKNLVTIVSSDYGLGTQLKNLYVNICTDVTPLPPLLHICSHFDRPPLPPPTAPKCEGNN